MERETRSAAAPSAAAPSAPVGPLADSTPGLGAEHVGRIVEAAAESHSASTRRNYAAFWARFRDWAAAEGLEALPAAPETVAAYLAERAAAGLSLSSLRTDRAAIRHRHAEAGHPNPAAHEGVRRVMRGLGRRAAREGRAAPRQAAALTAEGLAAIRATAQRRRAGRTGRTESRSTAFRRGIVDVALCAVMRDAMLRRSEAAALTWADVELRGDGTGRITVRRSKTDTEGEGAVLYVGKAAAADLRRLRELHRKDPDAAPVFRLTSGRAVSNRIGRAAKAARLEGRYSGHSPRVGMARDLVAAGAGVAAVQVAGRWASSRMPAHYARSELAARGAVASFYGE